MPSQKKATTHPVSARPTRSTSPTRSTRPAVQQPSAFSAHFLDRAHRREAAPGPGECLVDTELTRHAHWAGPWDVETIEGGDGYLHVVTRRSEPASDGGGARFAFLRRQDALLAAATAAALATPNHLRLNADKRSGRRSRLGHPIHDGPRHLGHAAPRPGGADDHFLAYYHAIRCLTANPEAGALYIEAQDTETLAILGRAIMRRLS